MAGRITNLGKRNRIDHMTGLYNKYEFEGDIKKYLVDTIGIMILDLDSFKNINDLYDRSFGDEVLRITAQKVSSILPANAKLYRLDGDEFGVLCMGCGEEAGREIFTKIQQVFHKQQEYSGRKYYCTISAGYTTYPKDGVNYLELLKCANYSLEHSKLMGKNRMTVFSKEGNGGWNWLNFCVKAWTGVLPVFPSTISPRWTRRPGAFRARKRWPGGIAASMGTSLLENSSRFWNRAG